LEDNWRGDGSSKVFGLRGNGNGNGNGNSSGRKWWLIAVAVASR